MSLPAPADGAPFARLLGASPTRREPPWLQKLRAQARLRFGTVGLPLPTDEDWRHTNVRPLATLPFDRSSDEGLSARELASIQLAEAVPARLVLVNGRVDPGLTRLPGLPDGVRVESLATALATRGDVIEPHLGHHATIAKNPFVALNTALFEDGALITIGAGITLDTPIHVVHVARPGSGPAASFPRTLVVLEAGASASLVESFAGVGTAASLTCAVTETVLGDGARLEHVKVQMEGENAWHIATVAGHQGATARLTSHNVSLGARLARNDIGSSLSGEGAECFLYGLYLVDGAQHVDNHTALDHQKAHCPSWEMYKGVLAGSARAVFNGRIVVREDAQKTDAKQSNKNLILSSGAAVYTRPQLEIYANDVKCTHGATIGRLDESALFYLRARGIGAREARDLLVHAFVGDVLAKIPIEPVRAILRNEMDARLDRELTAAAR